MTEARPILVPTLAFPCASAKIVRGSSAAVADKRFWLCVSGDAVALVASKPDEDAPGYGDAGALLWSCSCYKLTSICVTVEYPEPERNPVVHVHLEASDVPYDPQAARVNLGASSSAASLALNSTSSASVIPSSSSSQHQHHSQSQQPQQLPSSRTPSSRRIAIAVKCDVDAAAPTFRAAYFEHLKLRFYHWALAVPDLFLASTPKVAEKPADRALYPNWDPTVPDTWRRRFYGNQHAAAGAAEEDSDNNVSTAEASESAAAVQSANTGPTKKGKAKTDAKAKAPKRKSTTAARREADESSVDEPDARIAPSDGNSAAAATTSRRPTRKAAENVSTYYQADKELELAIANASAPSKGKGKAREEVQAGEDAPPSKSQSRRKRRASGEVEGAPATSKRSKTTIATPSDQAPPTLVQAVLDKVLGAIGQSHNMPQQVLPSAPAQLYPPMMLPPPAAPMCDSGSRHSESMLVEVISQQGSLKEALKDATQTLAERIIDERKQVESAMTARLELVDGQLSKLQSALDEQRLTMSELTKTNDASRASLTCQHEHSKTVAEDVNRLRQQVDGLAKAKAALEHRVQTVESQLSTQAKAADDREACISSLEARLQTIVSSKSIQQSSCPRPASASAIASSSSASNAAIASPDRRQPPPASPARNGHRSPHASAAEDSPHPRFQGLEPQSQPKQALQFEQKQPPQPLQPKAVEPVHVGAAEQAKMRRQRSGSARSATPMTEAHKAPPPLHSSKAVHQQMKSPVVRGARKSKNAPHASGSTMHYQQHGHDKMLEQPHTATQTTSGPLTSTEAVSGASTLAAEPAKLSSLSTLLSSSIPIVPSSASRPAAALVPDPSPAAANHSQLIAPQDETSEQSPLANSALPGKPKGKSKSKPKKGKAKASAEDESTVAASLAPSSAPHHKKQITYGGKNGRADRAWSGKKTEHEKLEATVQELIEEQKGLPEADQFGQELTTFKEIGIPKTAKRT